MSLDESLSDNISSISSQKEKIIRATSHGSCYTRCFGHTPERCSNANCFLWSFQVFRGPMVALGDSPLLSFMCHLNYLFKYLCISIGLCFYWLVKILHYRHKTFVRCLYCKSFQVYGLSFHFLNSVLGRASFPFDKIRFVNYFFFMV